jgi:hypothetical protein
MEPLKVAWVDTCTAFFDCTVSFDVCTNWVDNRVGPGVLEEGKVLCSCRELNHDSSVPVLQASCYSPDCFTKTFYDNNQMLVQTECVDIKISFFIYIS